jgi:hypothetical protein
MEEFISLPTDRDNQVFSLQDAYKLLGAETPLELNEKYVEEDQKLFKAGEWDYENPELLTNQVKEMLEKVDATSLNEDEREWRQEILWFWNHHAISIAVWKHRDRAAALQFAEKALALQPESHPNQITRLLYYLVRGDIAIAKAHAATITDEVEGPTANDLITEYEEQPWFT